MPRHCNSIESASLFTKPWSAPAGSTEGRENEGKGAVLRFVLIISKLHTVFITLLFTTNYSIVTFSALNTGKCRVSERKRFRARGRRTQEEGGRAAFGGVVVAPLDGGHSVVDRVPLEQRDCATAEAAARHSRAVDSRTRDGEGDELVQLGS